MINKIKELYNNKWVKFSIVSFFYILIFTVWTRNLFSLLLLPVIYDYYISKKYKVWFWNKHLSIKAKNSTYKFISGWVDAIVVALVVATILRTFLIEMYVIPSPSMEKTLLVGDYIGVSKVTYGPKVPNTPLALPLVHNINPLDAESKSYVEWIKWGYKRLAGFRDVERGDVIVFNYPQGDTVLVSDPQMNYYTLKRHYGKEYLDNISKIMVHPVDKRDNYIKRAVAISGDLFAVKDGDVYIGGKREDVVSTMLKQYSIQFNPGAITRTVMESNSISESDITSFNKNQMKVFISKDQADNLSKLNGVQNVVRMINNDPSIDVFPYDTLNYKFNEDNFGPITIPQKGATVSINANNLSLYHRIITAYEKNTLELKDNGDIYINGLKTHSYTFKMNYFFAMGDNRDNSLDSRFFGFVPEDHIVGSASFIWMSIDNSKSFPKNIRFSRMFKSID